MKATDFYIRDYLPEDYEQVIHLWEYTGMGGKARGDNQHTISKTLNLGGKLIVLIEKSTENVIGSSWLTSDGRRIYLHHFGILPELQGKGLSSLLLDASMEFAKKSGMQIKLEVHKDNLAAIKIYKKAGFKYLGDYLVYIVRNYDEIN